jgi:hypothetical protein
MCVVALILGMLMFHMLKNICGCKNVVEGLNLTSNDGTNCTFVPDSGGCQTQWRGYDGSSEVQDSCCRPFTHGPSNAPYNCEFVFASGCPGKSPHDDGTPLSDAEKYCCGYDGGNKKSTPSPQAQSQCDCDTFEDTNYKCFPNKDTHYGSAMCSTICGCKGPDFVLGIDWGGADGKMPSDPGAEVLGKYGKLGDPKTTIFDDANSSSICTATDKIGQALPYPADGKVISVKNQWGESADSADHNPDVCPEGLGTGKGQCKSYIGQTCRNMFEQIKKEAMEFEKLFNNNFSQDYVEDQLSERCGYASTENGPCKYKGTGKLY